MENFLIILIINCFIILFIFFIYSNYTCTHTFTYTYWNFIDYVLYLTVPFWYFLTFPNIYFYSLGCFYFSSQRPLYFQLNLRSIGHPGTESAIEIILFFFNFFLSLGNSIFTSSCPLCISSLTFKIYDSWGFLHICQYSFNSSWVVV